MPVIVVPSGGETSVAVDFKTASPLLILGSFFRRIIWFSGWLLTPL